jgi:hypothetical protein
MVRKVSQVAFPLLYGNDSSLTNFNSANKYPLIFFVKQQAIVSTLFPIPSDESHSKSWMKLIEKRIADGC